MNAEAFNRRILVIDDDTAIRETYRSILQPQPLGSALLQSLLNQQAAPVREAFEVATAAQGQEGVSLAATALAQGQPFALAFIDMRMPPGWNGLRTAVALRALDPTVHIIIATAYADHDLDEIQSALGDNVVLLRKPFNRDEVFALARTLCQSWSTRLHLDAHASFLESVVEHLPVPLLILAADSRRLVRVNAAAERVLGQTRQALCGQVADAILPAPLVQTLDNTGGDDWLAIDGHCYGLRAQAFSSGERTLWLLAILEVAGSKELDGKAAG